MEQQYDRLLRGEITAKQYVETLIQPDGPVGSGAMNDDTTDGTLGTGHWWSDGQDDTHPQERVARVQKNGPDSIIIEIPNVLPLANGVSLYITFDPQELDAIPQPHLVLSDTAKALLQEGDQE